MLKIQRKDLLFIMVPLIIATLLYPFLPEQIPRHFGLNGEVKYVGKEFIFIIALFPFLLIQLRNLKKR